MYSVCGVALLGAAAALFLQTADSNAEFERFLQTRRKFWAAWQRPRPLPQPLVGFGFGQELTQTDLCLPSSGSDPFPPDAHVDIATRNGNRFAFHHRCPMTVRYSVQQVNDPLTTTSEELLPRLRDTLVAGIPESYSRIAVPDDVAFAPFGDATRTSTAEIYVDPDRHLAMTIGIAFDDNWSDPRNAPMPGVRVAAILDCSFPKRIEDEAFIEKLIDDGVLVRPIEEQNFAAAEASASVPAAGVTESSK